MKIDSVHLNLKSLQTLLYSTLWFYKSGQNFAPVAVIPIKWEIWENLIRCIAIDNVHYGIENLYTSQEEALSLYAVDLARKLLDTQCKIGTLTKIKE